MTKSFGYKESLINKKHEQLRDETTKGCTI